MKFKHLDRHKWFLKKTHLNCDRSYSNGIDEAVNRCLKCEYIRYCTTLPITPLATNICRKKKGGKNGN